MSLKICDPNSVPEENPTFSNFPFELSPFQKWAITGFDNSHNVLVTAHTGSGKTLVAEHAIMECLKRGKKVIYTSPIKALTNQKFYEFNKKFPDASIGILTGDIKYNPIGNVLLMTTEILRNLLFHKKIVDTKYSIELSLDLNTNLDFDCVIFDEIHYINDPDRGAVWEESLILLPKRIQLVMLSATIDNQEYFAKWLCKVRQRDLWLCPTTHRVVPLRHNLWMNIKTKIDSDDNVLMDDYNNKLIEFSSGNEVNDLNYNNVLKLVNKYSPPNMFNVGVLNDIISFMEIKGLLPAIIFKFSRIKCEEYAKLVSCSLLEGKQSLEVKEIVESYIRKVKGWESIINLPQFQDVYNLLQKGIAYHHSGLLPIVKEIIEILYGLGLVRVLFATETFAVGVNLPTKCVVFADLTKPDGSETSGGANYRFLHSHEYLQMAGRAGRRGIDTVGHVILLPTYCKLPSLLEMKKLLKGGSQVISSKLNPNYSLILKVIENGEHKLEDIVQCSLMETDVLKQAEQIEDEICKLEIPKEIIETDFSLIKTYNELCQTKIDGFITINKKTLEKNLIKARKLKENPEFNTKMELWNVYKDKLSLKEQFEKDLRRIKGYSSYKIKYYTKILIENGYISIEEPSEIKKENLTKKGIVACHIHEGNPIIISELLELGLIDKLDCYQLIDFLSLFTEQSRNFIDFPLITSEVPDWLKQIRDEVDHIKHQFISYFTKIGDQYDDSWEISPNKYLIFRDWSEGMPIEKLTEKYEIFAGNFMRDCIKLVNMAGELEQVAKIYGKKSLEVECSKIKDIILKERIELDSLYIKLN